MREWTTELLSRHADLIGWLAIISIITFVISIVVIPLVISKLPAEYFLPSHRQHASSSFGLRSKSILVLKNILGAILVCAGFLMFFIPGQGLLTMIIGLGLMNFPGKYEMERKLVSRPAVLKSMNWIRNKAGVTDLLTPNHEI